MPDTAVKPTEKTFPDKLLNLIMRVVNFILRGLKQNLKYGV